MGKITGAIFATTRRKPTSLPDFQKIIQKNGSTCRIFHVVAVNEAFKSLSDLKEGNVRDAFTFAAPNGVHYKDASVKQVDVPSFSGSFGILPDHVPALAVLAPGVVTVIEDSGDAAKFFVSSGTVTINDDSSVQILAEEAHSLDAFDANAAKAALDEATAAANAAGDDAAKAEAQIAVEVADALVKALA